MTEYQAQFKDYECWSPLAAWNTSIDYARDSLDSWLQVHGREMPDIRIQMRITITLERY